MLANGAPLRTLASSYIIRGICTNPVVDKHREGYKPVYMNHKCGRALRGQVARYTCVYRTVSQAASYRRWRRRKVDASLRTYQAQFQRPDSPRPELDGTLWLPRPRDVDFNAIPPAFAL